MSENSYSVAVVKELNYLANKNKTRLIVAGKYLENDNIAFVDRKNSSLLVTNTEDKSVQELDLSELLPEEYRTQNDENIPNPSDVNKGFEEDQLLITFTGDDYSVAVACKLVNEMGKPKLSQSLDTVKINNRSRSVIAMDSDTVCALTEESIVIKNKNDQDNLVVSFPRNNPERGGFLMTDGQGNVYYGDGDTFVSCYLDGTGIKERFRISRAEMKCPRGSAISVTSGRIFVCTEESNSIFSFSADGSDLKEEFHCKDLRFGDIDFNSEGKRFFTTFWKKNQWPNLYELRS